jgi:hypothetical protein
MPSEVSNSMKSVIMLTVNMSDPTRGTNHYTVRSDVHPFPNKKIGSAKVPQNIGGGIFSALLAVC